MDNMENKAVFFDRDDTLIEDTGYINNPDQVKLISGVAKSLLEFKEMGFKLIVVTNQSGIARGILTEKTLTEIHERLNVLLSEKGIAIDAFYYCPFHPEGVVPQYRRESDDRKPSPGMIFTAAQEHNIDLTQSWVVGNSPRDIDAGKRAGCKTILIEKKTRSTPLLVFKKDSEPAPDFHAVNMKEAVNIVKKHYRDLELQQKAEIASRSLERPRLRTIPPPATVHIPIVAPVSVPAPAPVPTTPPPQPPQQTTIEPLQPARSSRRSHFAPPPTASASPSPKNEPAESIVKPSIEDNSEPQSPELLLDNILHELKSLRKTESYREFSIIRLLAGLLQVVVFFCLLISVWLTMEPARKFDLILITLGFATVLQLMALTFYLMQNRK
jgi:D-glycero-D-manno-heptose 1,7-bisphosphate phosphatase